MHVGDLKLNFIKKVTLDLFVNSLFQQFAKNRQDFNRPTIRTTKCTISIFDQGNYFVHFPQFGTCATD